MDLKEIKELLMDESNRLEPSHTDRRREEKQEYARGIRDAYYLIEKHERNKKENT